MRRAPRGPRHILTALFALAALSSLAACEGATCPAGQRAICRDANDCRCGPGCTQQSECAGLTACARFRDDPSGQGVCVDALWLFGSEPPCVPLCNEREVCVGWSEGRASCARPCEQDRDCAGCCAPLSDGRRVCAPADVCREFYPCGTAGCADGEQCVLFSTPACARRCDFDEDCEASCCIPLEGGGGVCSPGGTLCPTSPPPGPCRSLDACVTVRSGPSPSSGACADPTQVLYEGSARNVCPESAECVACWWSASTGAYSDCVRLPTLPTDGEAPLGSYGRCYAGAATEPRVRVRCVDTASARGPDDCLSSAGP